VLGSLDLCVSTRQLAEHPAGQQLVDAAVEHDGGERRIEVGAELSTRLPALNDATNRLDRFHEVADPLLHFGAARNFAHENAHDVGLMPPGPQDDRGDVAQLVLRGIAGLLDRVDALDEQAPVLAEDRLEDFVLRREVVVQQAVRDAGFLRDVADARRVEPLSREDADGCVEDQSPFLFRTGCALGQGCRRVVVVSGAMQALGGTLVVDFTRFLPGAFASREFQQHGARVIRVEQPGGDPMRLSAPEWYDALNAGKESVVCELPGDGDFARALLERADVILESFRPGVATRLGIGPDAAPPRAVYCSLTGFGLGGAHEQRAGHDLNYVGWAGLLEDTAPALPPVQAADLAAGALSVVTEVLAALLARERTGRGAHLVVSMTHGAQRLTPGSPVLTHGFACYSIYACADGRYLTVGALEPKFFQRLCELVGRPELAERQYDPHQSDLKNALAKVFSVRPLAEWLQLFDGEDVCVGPVATRAEAAAEFGAPTADRAATAGAHTADWQLELGL
jgi:alpha-methylacyl-CoA racemase